MKTTNIYQNGKLFHTESWDNEADAELYGEYFTTEKRKQTPDVWAWIVE